MSSEVSAMQAPPRPHPSPHPRPRPRPRPLHLTPLPQLQSSQLWPTEVQKVFDIVSEAYEKANQLLRLEDGDPIRLRLHSDRLTCRIIPLFQDLAERVVYDPWATGCLEALESTVEELTHAATCADQVYVSFPVFLLP